MRVLIVHQYFRTPEEGGAIRTYYLAQQLLNQGHEVMVWTTHNHQAGYLKVDGIPVRYFKLTYYQHFSFLRRIWVFYQFVQRCKNEARKHHDFDLAYVLTTPLSTGFIARYLKKKYRIPYAFEVGDLWPEVPIQMGILKFGPLIHYLRRLERNIYQQAEKLIALSPDIKDRMDYTMDFERKIHIAPNMADLDRFQPVFSTTETMGHFHIVYAGAIGYANHLEYLVEVARNSLKRKMPIKFTIMGEGSQFESIANLSADLGNLTMLHHGSKEEVNAVIQKAHAVYISYLNVPILGTGSPNKFFDGLAAGKLIIINFTGWIKSLIEIQECGFYHDPLKPDQCLDALQRFIESPLLLESYQQHARELAEQSFSVDKVTRDLVAFLQLR
jgi:glycosyltransferase involved in cell wall biosynthesis